MKFAIGEVGADVADVAAAPADEEREPAPSCCRISFRCNAIATHERVAKIVEWRASGQQRLLVRRKRFGHVDGKRFVVKGGLGTEAVPVTPTQPCVGADQRGDPRQVTAHLVDGEYRSQALRP